MKRNYSANEYLGTLVCDASDLPVTTSELTRHQIRIQAENSSYYGRLNNCLSITFTEPEPSSINVKTDLKQVEIDPFSQGQFEDSSINANVLP